MGEGVMVGDCEGTSFSMTATVNVIFDPVLYKDSCNWPPSIASSNAMIYLSAMFPSSVIKTISAVA